jgi:hypothetical protein
MFSAHIIFREQCIVSHMLAFQNKNAAETIGIHGRRNLGGGRMSICPTSAEGARTSRASKMPFPAFWGEILFMERVKDEEKINETTPSLMTILIS